MPERCPTCGHALTAMTTVERVRSWCQEHAHEILPDDSVFEDVAALILGVSAHTLQNRRAGGNDLVRAFRVGRTGRVRYRILDLAAALDTSRSFPVRPNGTLPTPTGAAENSSEYFPNSEAP